MDDKMPMVWHQTVCEKSGWPIRRVPNRIDYVNEAQSAKELTAVRNCLQRGCHTGISHGRHKQSSD